MIRNCSMLVLLGAIAAAVIATNTAAAPGAMPTALRGHGSRWPFGFDWPLSAAPEILTSGQPEDCLWSGAVDYAGVRVVRYAWSGNRYW